MHTIWELFAFALNVLVQRLNKSTEYYSVFLTRVFSRQPLTENSLQEQHSQMPLLYCPLFHMGLH